MTVLWEGVFLRRIVKPEDWRSFVGYHVTRLPAGCKFELAV